MGTELHEDIAQKRVAITPVELEGPVTGWGKSIHSLGPKSIRKWHYFKDSVISRCFKTDLRTQLITVTPQPPAEADACPVCWIKSGLTKRGEYPDMSPI